MAAAAIRHELSPFADIKVTSKRCERQHTSDKGLLAFGSFNPSCGSQIYSFPVSTCGVYSDTTDYADETTLCNEAILEVNCTNEDKGKVSRIIISHGGNFN
jgi:hypothetical protein